MEAGAEQGSFMKLSLYFSIIYMYMYNIYTSLYLETQ
jgi:hypothetical protein